MNQSDNIDYKVASQDRLYYDDQDQLDETQFELEDDYLTDDIENERTPNKTVRFGGKDSEVIEYEGKETGGIKLNNHEDIKEHMGNVSAAAPTATTNTSPTSTINQPVQTIQPAQTIQPVQPIQPAQPVSDTSGFGISGSSSLISCLCLFILMLLLAYLRGDLVNKDGSINLIMVLCVMLFPQFYIGFAIVDFATGHTRDKE
jgi:hypothetical protein